MIAAVRLQINGYLIKPVSPKSLGARLRDILTTCPTTTPT
jgi:DNA-binding response OmpR family regulator